MARNQGHGEEIEGLLAHALIGRPVPRSWTNAWDIDAALDWRHGLNTSIKTMGVRGAFVENATVAMSDARRIFSIDCPFRMLVAPYRQLGPIKQVDQVFEFFIQGHEMAELYGELSYEDVSAFHEGLLGFGAGQHVPARSWARAQKTTLAGRDSAFILNPKIDSKTQRRLQCSLRLGSLLQHVQHRIVHTGHFYGLPLPLQIHSTPREFSL